MSFAIGPTRVNFSDVEPMLGKEVEILSKRSQFEGKLICAHATFVQVGLSGYRFATVFMDDILAVRSLEG